MKASVRKTSEANATRAAAFHAEATLRVGRLLWRAGGRRRQGCLQFTGIPLRFQDFRETPIEPPRPVNADAAGRKTADARAVPASVRGDRARGPFADAAQTNRIGEPYRDVGMPGVFAQMPTREAHRAFCRPPVPFRAGPPHYNFAMRLRLNTPSRNRPATRRVPRLPADA